MDTGKNNDGLSLGKLGLILSIAPWILVGGSILCSTIGISGFG